MADLFLGLAVAVVKAAVSLWTKDNAFASSVADLVADKVTGDLDQRRARRFFEDLEVPVAKRLAAAGSSAFAGLPDNERTAAVLAAAASFGRARFTGPDLFSRDLDPLSLERHVLAGDPAATRDLSDAATALYGRLVSDGCAYIIEIADKLPRFQTGAFTEVLRRERQILARIDEVLDRIPARAAGASEEARFVTACRRHIATRLDRLELFGLDFEAGWYPLSVAYVSLRAEQSDGSHGGTVEDRLAESRRTLLLGRAGSGKTTVLRWLAVSAARASFTGALADLNGCFPFYLRLRDYVGRSLPLPEDFLAATAPMLAAEAPDGWARAQLDSGRALVLVDGADELPPAERQAAAGWLGDLIERFPHPVYVVSARPAAVTDDWLADLGFRRSSLEPMPPALIREFIGNWHEATRRQLPGADERAELSTYEQGLLAEIDRDRYLRDLADTPLLAGLLCALNRYLRASLPRRRAEIYERALAMFDQRDRARGISGGFDLDLTARTHLLAGLALWMVRNGESEVSFLAASAQVTRSLATVAGSREYPHGAVFRFLLERSGLLREPVAGHVDFVHRTFQEYLAGRAAVDGDAIGELIANAGNDQWGEVVVLAAGQANQAQAARLLRGLLRRGWLGQQQYRRRVLAVASLQEVRSLDASLRRDVEAAIPVLLPPQSMEQAEQLAAAGDALLPLLGLTWRQDPGRASESIRAASLIGGAEALTLIHGIAAASDVPAAPDEVHRAWQYFDPGEFARVVLPGLRFDHIDLGLFPASRVAGLRHAGVVRSLAVDYRLVSEVDFAALAAVPGLMALRLVAPLLPEPPGPITLPRVQMLTLTMRHGLDWFRLPALPVLSDLSLYVVDGVQSLRGVERLRSLTRLSLTPCQRLQSIKPLGQLPLLRTIDLHGAHGLTFADYRPSPSAQVTFILRECGPVDITPLRKYVGVRIHHDARTMLLNSDGLPPARITKLKS